MRWQDLLNKMSASQSFEVNPDEYYVAWNETTSYLFHSTAMERRDSPLQTVKFTQKMFSATVNFTVSQSFSIAAFSTSEFTMESNWFEAFM